MKTADIYGFLHRSMKNDLPIPISVFNNSSPNAPQAPEKK
jgi:hypothetical protein